VPTADHRAKPLADLIQRIRASWPGAAWEWDERFGCALSAVAKPEEAQALALLTTELGPAFSAATIQNAPPDLVQVCARAGGLWAEQRAFATALPEGGTVFCLWWPWGDGTSFSARVGATGALAALIRPTFALDEG
jgi:hypothetical protein